MANTFLQKLLGESYREGMTEDEIASAIEKSGLGKPAPASNESEEMKKLKDLLSKANSEAADYKKQLRAKLSEAEAKEIEEKEARDNLLKQNQELTKRISVSENSAELLKMGYDAELAVQTAEALYSGDLPTVFANQKKFLEARESKLKAELLKQTPAPPAGGVPQGVTLDALRKMSVEERYRFSQDHPEEYRQLYENK